MSFQFWGDAALVLPQATRYVGEIITAPQTDFRVWLGSLDDTVKAQAESNPGVDAIVLSIDDAAGGSGWDPTVVKLALSQPALDGAVAGAGLALGVELLGGVANARELWARVETGSLVEARFADLRLITNALVLVPA